jgi:uncharacterized protein (DUF302 family)
VCRHGFTHDFDLHGAFEARYEWRMTYSQDSGLIARKSAHSVDETVRKLKEALIENGVKLFAIIDHSGEAEQVGLQMPNTKLVIFGNPKAGTPIMLTAPSLAIDLPLKILVAEDSAGDVWLTYNTPGYLQKRHGFPEALEQAIAGAQHLASHAAQ